MKYWIQYIAASLMGILMCLASTAQQQWVKVIKASNEKKVSIFIGDQFFASFLYPDTLEKPVLYPLTAANGMVVTRGFPLQPIAGDPNDHPHHIGMWLNFENVNGIDFWNNSFAIAPEKKYLYGWIKTDSITETGSGTKGVLSYHANWVNQQNHRLLAERTRFTFSGTAHLRIIDRQTTLQADTAILFTDAKDGMLGIRLAHALQLPTSKDQEFKDDKGNITTVKGGSDTIAKGNYLTSEGLQGDSVWSTRAAWCKVYGKMGNDSVSVVIIDHPSNFNFPTFWHARGYGLFAANPLGEKVFTNGKTFKNLKLAKGGMVTFRYRIIIGNGHSTISAREIDQLAADFAKLR